MSLLSHLWLARLRCLPVTLCVRLEYGRPSSPQLECPQKTALSHLWLARPRYPPVILLWRLWCGGSSSPQPRSLPACVHEQLARSHVQRARVYGQHERRVRMHLKQTGVDCQRAWI